MGLDCYVQYDSKVEGSDEVEALEVWYGRKENEIHGWMQRKSGVEAGDFNCERLYLTREMMVELKEDFRLGLLTPTSGFFFGAGSEAEWVGQKVNQIVDVVNKCLDNGLKPYYFSWW